MGIFDFLRGRGKKRLTELRAEGGCEVYILEERPVVANMHQDGKPYVCVLNEAMYLGAI